MSLVSVVFSALVIVLITIKIKSTSPGYSALLSIGACIMLMYFVVGKLSRIISYIDRLTSYVSVDIAYIDIILKMTGISYICQFAGDICRDAGCTAIATQVETAGKISLVLLSMPVLMSVIDLVVRIVEG